MYSAIEASWKSILLEEFSKPYSTELSSRVEEAYLTEQIYPPQESLFNAFKHCPFDDVKVVILGQDPYHGPGQAHGLSFSVPEGVPIPPSLRNIYKEIKRDLGTPIPTHGNLKHWATQGVLLLNATLTVRAHEAGSHQGWGWETFTDAVIQAISDQKEHLVFMLWGKYAQEKGGDIDTTKHLVLQSVHPSPLSAHRGFIGCGHFSAANEYLTNHNLKPITW